MDSRFYRYVLLIVIFLGPFYSGITAQDVQKWEGEASLGVTIPVGGYHHGSPMVGAQLGLELRHNFEDPSLDLSIAVLTGTAERDFSGVRQTNGVFISASFIDYNVKQGSKFNPYFGVGIGFGSTESEGKYKGSTYSPMLLPRVGLELLYHIRITAGLTLTRHGFSYASLSLGVVIGGRPIKD